MRVLGADHPQAKIMRGNLAAARQHPQQCPPGVRTARQEAAGVPEGRKHAVSDLA
jgi:hypothetical protein